MLEIDINVHECIFVPVVTFFDKAFAMPCVTDNFGFKQEERFDCGAKAGDVFAGQRRFPQQMYWDYKVMMPDSHPCPLSSAWN